MNVYNGDVIKMMFPDIKIVEDSGDVLCVGLDGSTLFSSSWWHSRYYETEKGDDDE